MRALSTCPCAYPCPSVAENSPLMADGECFRFKRGQVIWNEGDEADSLAVVCTGALKLTRSLATEREAILDLVSRGQMVGEECLTPGSSRPAGCVALAAGKGFLLPRARALQILAENPDLYATLFKVACRRMETFTTRLGEIAQGPVENRLARVLLRISDELGLPDARGRFVPLRLTRGDLADLVGCRVETTIRVMTRWQREGVLETQREGFVIRDPDQLGEVASQVA